VAFIVGACPRISGLSARMLQREVRQPASKSVDVPFARTRDAGGALLRVGARKFTAKLFSRRRCLVHVAPA